MATFSKEFVSGFDSLEAFANEDGCYLIYESDSNYHTVREPSDEEALLNSPQTRAARLVWRRDESGGPTRAGHLPVTPGQWASPTEPASPGNPPSGQPQSPDTDKDTDTAPPPEPGQPATGPGTSPAVPPPAAVAGRRRRRRGKWIVVIAVTTALTLVAVIVWVLTHQPGPRPVGLETTKVESGAVSLVWSRPKESKAPQSYLILRNGSVVGRVGAVTFYQDVGLAPLTQYRYSVIAVVEGRESHPTPDLVVKTLPASPASLKPGEVTTTSAAFEWAAPDGPAPDRYIVRRDGADIATVPASTRSYKDTGLAPVMTSSYTVVAVTQGLTSAPSAALAITTLTPPVGEARLSGAWDVKVKVTKTPGGNVKTGETEDQMWTFTPMCGSGACMVSVSGGLWGHPFTASLKRTGASYRGLAKAHIMHCVDRDVSNSLTLALNVTDAGMETRTWAATAWTGTIDLVSPYTSAGSRYCPTQSHHFSVAGTGTTV